MKTLNSTLILIVLIAAAVYAVSFIGCSDTLTSSTSGITEKRTLIEEDFKNDASRHLLPGDLAMIDLEYLHSPWESSDIDSTGMDIIPFEVSKTENVSFDLEGDSLYVFIINGSGNKIFEMTPGKPAGNLSLEKGIYKAYIYSMVEFKNDSISYSKVFINFEEGKTDNSVSDIRLKISNNICVNCRFERCRIAALFLRTNLSGSSFTHCTFEYSAFFYANLSNIYGFYNKMRDVEFMHTDLSGTRLIELDLRKARIGFSNLSNSIFSRTKSFTDASFFGCNMEKMELNLTQADTALSFVQNNMSMIDFSGIQNYKVKKMRANNLTRAFIRNIDGKNINFSRNNLTKAIIVRCNFYGADMSGNDFFNCSISYSNFCNRIGNVINTHNIEQIDVQCPL